MTNHTFDTALTGLKHGIKYNRKDTLKNKPNSYYSIEDGELYFTFPANMENTVNKFKVETLLTQDILTNDWVVVD